MGCCERECALETAAHRRPPPSKPGLAQVRLERILHRETGTDGSRLDLGRHATGANDGLAAVFAIVAGPGRKGASHFVLTAGVPGAVASAVSMADRAFPRERSQVEWPRRTWSASGSS